MEPTNASTSGPQSALRRLAAKGAAAAWTGADDIDWDRKIRIPTWLPRRFAAAVVSQFYHGELATGAICIRLQDRITEADARRCLVQQGADEDRHAEVYQAYLARLGELAEPDAAMDAVFDQALAWTGPPEGAVAAFNVIIEGEALRTLDDLATWLPCPLFRQINARVAADEARHFAFGRLYLKARLGTLERGERLDIYRWLKGLWDDSAFGILDKFHIPGFVTRGRRKAWAEDGWRGHRRQLMDAGLIAADEIRLAEDHAAAGAAG